MQFRENDCLLEEHKSVHSHRACWQLKTTSVRLAANGGNEEGESVNPASSSVPVGFRVGRRAAKKAFYIRIS